MSEIQNQNLIEYVHNVINTCRNIKTSRNVFTLPIPIPLERHHIKDNLNTYDYVIYENSEDIKGERVLLVFLTYDNEHYIIAYTKDNRYYNLTCELVFKQYDKDIFNNTILECILHRELKKLVVRDIISFSNETVYNVFFGTRKEYMVQIIDEIFDKEQSNYSLVLTEFNDFNNIKYDYTEHNYKDKFNSLIFVPQTIPIGINIQRTMFYWENVPSMTLNLFKNTEKNKLEISTIDNKKKENVLFASIDFTSEKAKCFENVNDGLYDFTYNMEKRTFEILRDKTYNNKPHSLRILEQIFCSIRESISCDDIFLNI